MSLYQSRNWKIIFTDFIIQVIFTILASVLHAHSWRRLFLLCEEFQKDKPRTRRMTRHFYDLEKLLHTPYAEIALTDTQLYKDIVAHREKFYHVGYVDYSKEMPSEITILPPNALRSEYEADYKDMQKSFIYVDSLDFETLMGEINKLQTRFRSIQQL